MDGRRRQYVPVSVDIARSRTGQRLLERFGTDGLLVWILVLAAAKRSSNQGEFEYVTEADGWHRLGIPPPKFTLNEFFAYTGRLHNTKRDRERARNGIQTIEIRAWNEWNTSVERELSAGRMSRKRAKTARNNRRTEVEVEVEIEEIDEQARAKNAEAARRLTADLTRKLGRAT